MLSANRCRTFEAQDPKAYHPQHGKNTGRVRKIVANRVPHSACALPEFGWEKHDAERQVIGGAVTVGRASGAAGGPGLGRNHTDGESEVPAGPTGLSRDFEPSSLIVSADSDGVEGVAANRRGDLAARRFSQFAQIGANKQNEDSHGAPQYRRGNSVEPPGKPVGSNRIVPNHRSQAGNQTHVTHGKEK